MVLEKIMYLKRLDLQGFKTFAQKTVLQFELDAENRRGLTAVVGPNGSGKSNIADALRWVMGEQSLKLLRAKKSEDVIFSGSEKKSRAGFSEVSITLVNDDRQDLDFSEIVITRRLYRDGQSEYEVNKQSARLSDVVMLLAQCGIGQRTYSVIGQGMVDDVLSASPAERKDFFDEAAGLRPFQLKRHASVNKLEAARDNLRQSETLLREIGPRLVSLERQVKRLQQRETLEEDLKALEIQYYGGMWSSLRKSLSLSQTAYDKALARATQAAGEADKLESELRNMEKAIPPSQGFKELRESLNKLSEEKVRLREQQMRLESTREIAKVRAEKPWAPLPLSKIIGEIESLHKKQLDLLEMLEKPKSDAIKIMQLAREVHNQAADLLGKLQRPAPEPEKQNSEDPKLEAETAKILGAISEVEHKIQAAQIELDQWNKKEDQKRSHIFDVQRELSRRRQEAQMAERQMSEASVELARVETRREAFLQELRAQRPEQETNLDSLADKHQSGEAPEALLPRITKLRAQLEWIGGIDPETLKEYDQTKQRFDELNEQTTDLTQAIISLETIIKELDQTINERSAVSFRNLNQQFGLYFKRLFGGGSAELVEVFPEPEINEQGEVVESQDKNNARVGIDILATPPGKRLKAIALLSGGERALVSIALICAIMATNPSPFVVLDEVDAALDESNSNKFAEILNTLADRTQFVVVSHNRATMSRAHILYGVTMGVDGVSQLLSVKLHDILPAK
ncbi:MAG: Chromosome partition protein Smc [Parcubacteria group bacterium ADurb.Bin192]|nr:MAG: Chromosome partition protein Smc [Parcubacteria group bacterium ADurb.Bin192]